MSALSVIERPVAFHMSVNVADMDRAIAFYRVLFGIEPAKCHPDYAKFEVTDPPVAFSLVPHAVGHGGVMSHLGLRLTSEGAVREMQRRLHAAGIRTREQNNTRGCYAVQTKVWVEDPDQNQWEIYVLFEDLRSDDVAGTCSSPLPAAEADGPDRHVVYKGPFRDLTDDEGRVYPRGQTVAVPPGVWEGLRQGPAADQFAFLAPETVPVSCH